MRLYRHGVLAGLLFAAALTCVSCASSSRLRVSADPPLAVEHIRGNVHSCLADCAEMVLRYYRVPQECHFPRDRPLELGEVDSLVQSVRTRPDFDLRSFVLQKDAVFLDTQVEKARPVIVIFKHAKYYHSVVVTGANGAHYFVHDPAQRKGQWMSRKQLLKQWSTSGNLLVLIAPESQKSTPPEPALRMKRAFG